MFITADWFVLLLEMSTRMMKFLCLELFPELFLWLKENLLTCVSISAVKSDLLATCVCASAFNVSMLQQPQALEPRHLRVMHLVLQLCRI
jgi:hypothetical protein